MGASYGKNTLFETFMLVFIVPDPASHDEN
jgi:hypothetical protein